MREELSERLRAADAAIMPPSAWPEDAIAYLSRKAQKSTAWEAAANA